MRVAITAYRGSMASGGLGIYLNGLTRALAARGFEIDLFVGPPYPGPMPWLRQIRIPNDHFWSRRFTSSWAAPLPRRGHPLRLFEPLRFWELAVTRFGFLPEPFAFSVRAAREIIARARRGARYTLVHDVQTLGYGLLWLRALGLPAVATVHHPLSVDLRFSLQRDRTFLDRKGSLTLYPVRSQARVARRLEGIVTSCEASARELTTGFGVAPERIHNVGNGVDLPPPGRLRARPDPIELLFVGRSGDPNKGLEYLLQALARIPEPVQLRVLDGPPEGTHLMRLIERLQLRERVRFVGKLPRADLERALRQATALVMPSLFEGFGIPAVEALASGTPVVATDAGALAEVIGRAGAGVVVRSGDAGALASGIARVLKEWERAHREALDARARIEREFGWPEVAARTAHVYARGVDATRTPRR